MARLVIVIGITHNPFHHRLTRQPRPQWSRDTENTAQRGELMREKLRRASPESLVMVGNDHLHQFFMNNMPAFILGKMEVFDGIFYNEVREFDLPRCRIPGDMELARWILDGMLHKGVDLAFSDEMKVDHSVVVPLLFIRPELDLPIVPVMSNCIAPPLPSARRFYEVGRALREVIEELPEERRIGAVVTGNLALEVGGPLQFNPRPMDEAFDEAAVGWIRTGDAEAAMRECTHERLTAAGNVSHAFLNFILAMGLAAGLRPSHVEGLRRAGSTQPFFAWEPAAGSAA